jgi:hypothetical protein
MPRVCLAAMAKRPPTVIIAAVAIPEAVETPAEVAMSRTETSG